MMDFGAIDPVIFVATLIVAAVPILLAAIGELVVEKAGVLNLGVEGMMIMGAIAGFIVAVQTGSPVLGFLGGALSGAALSLVFAFLTQVLLANQVATGLALTLFGLGLSSLLGQGYNGIKPPATSAIPFGPLADLPVLGPILFSHDWMVYASVATVAAVWWVLKSTRLGLIIRATGESHDAAHALGFKVNRIRLLCILFGGAMAGLGGAYISLVRVPQWVDGITAGAGWIALAIVVFASWKPWRALIGAYLFGGITVLQLSSQVAGGLPAGFILLIAIVAILLVGLFATLSIRAGRGFDLHPLWLALAAVPPVAYAVCLILGAESIVIPVEYLSMSPYLVTILVLVIMSSGRGRASLNAPAALGQNFHAAR
jgi:simple sugar transport system permease protein